MAQNTTGRGSLEEEGPLESTKDLLFDAHESVTSTKFHEIASRPQVIKDL